MLAITDSAHYVHLVSTVSKCFNNQVTIWLQKIKGVYIFTQTLYESRAAGQEFHMPCESETFEDQKYFETL
jgi:hypothetical protein